jgi:hypothetical protein
MQESVEGSPVYLKLGLSHKGINMILFLLYGALTKSFSL